jgi:flavin reductase (DIM6/NTAB) family NADH-FMN oxidoreductase RutF
MPHPRPVSGIDLQPTIVSRSDFMAIMGVAPGPATIVTAFDAAGQPCGLTMAAVCSVSLSPPMLLACLDLGSTRMAAIRDSGSFTVNYLATGGEQLALHFAGKSPNKFENVQFGRSQAGIGGPLLQPRAAYAACRVVNIVRAGDHDIVVGRSWRVKLRQAKARSPTRAGRSFRPEPKSALP